ncbi:hypothetical protein GO984_08165 [Rhodobacteraceae bacterium CY05]|uniref:Uncharacterized protein n=2 Tax=Parasedimentitalea huanghaiensis TaxID=2682100 RepID=A0A6L6WEV7_9RHOB|nr:hypothetical protein [Zongyanglinia huanghaiensis]
MSWDERLVTVFSYTVNIILLVLLIFVGSYATTELATRISAKAFVDQRLLEARSELGEAALTRVAQGDLARDTSPSADIDKLTQRESELKVLRENLSALEFAGAQSSDSSVYAVQSRYEALAFDQQRQVQRDSLGRQIEAGTAKLNSLVQEYGILQQITAEWETDTTNKGDINSLGSLLELSHKELVSLIPAEDLASSAWLNNFDSQVVNALRKFKQTLSVEETPDGKFVTYQNLDRARENLFSPDSLNPDRMLLGFRDFAIAVKDAEAAVGKMVTAAETELERQKTALDELNALVDGVIAMPHWASSVPWLFPLSYLPNDLLLAVVVITCAAIGSLFSGLRADAPAPLLRAPVGAVAGFICFLIMKGGKFLFIVQTAGVVLPINPFAAAFAGIVAGLFTERAYLLLERMMNRVADDLERSQAKTKEADDAKDEKVVEPVLPTPQPTGDGKGQNGATPAPNGKLDPA